MELLLYVDEKNCALLKKAAMDFLVKEREEVRKKVSFENAPGHFLMNDLLMAMDSDNNMRISTLRRWLMKRGFQGGKWFHYLKNTLLKEGIYST